MVAPILTAAHVAAVYLKDNLKLKIIEDNGVSREPLAKLLN
jgi:hypothetical protein